MPKIEERPEVRTEPVRRRKRKRTLRAVLPTYVLLALILAAVFIAVYLVTGGAIGGPDTPSGDSPGAASGEAVTDTPTPDSATPTPIATPTPDATPTPTATPTPPTEPFAVSDVTLFSENAILVRVGGGAPLIDVDSDKRIYPASMTKIMTAVVALENISDLSEKITLSEKLFAPIYEANASIAGFLPNEKVRAIDLLYGLMLPSGAECAIGLAERVSGSESAFADAMNAKARELHMDGTHFVNSSGLHDENHYSTAADIAVLLEYALRDDTFRKIVSSAKYSTAATNLHPDGITIRSTLFTALESPDFAQGVILGGKTGYTGEAGQCLASFAELDGERFVFVTCAARGELTENRHIADALAVYAAIRRA
jgi:D-alanyl-D-alanine carboxypeptidase (penicillin-binding protein 5/6)